MPTLLVTSHYTGVRRWAIRQIQGMKGLNTKRLNVSQFNQLKVLCILKLTNVPYYAIVGFARDLYQSMLLGIGLVHWVFLV